MHKKRTKNCQYFLRKQVEIFEENVYNNRWNVSAYNSERNTSGKKEVSMNYEYL